VDVVWFTYVEDPNPRTIPTNIMLLNEAPAIVEAAMAKTIPSIRRVSENGIIGAALMPAALYRPFAIDPEIRPTK
jgi:hypothetical protein